jgi:hypothetical protein
MKSRYFAIFGALLALLVLSSCLPGDGKNSEENLAGFWTGVWHGAIAPISLIVGLFNKAIRVYETSNKGWWYDFGFFLAIASGVGTGGSAAARRRRRHEPRE